MGWFCQKPNDPKRVAICVGHSRKGDFGARSVSGMSEWAYNRPLADELQEELIRRGLHADVFSDYQKAWYNEAIKWLAGRLKKGNYDIAIELHFNSYDSSSARGHEYLYFHKSANGKRLAQAFSDNHEQHLPDMVVRGPKAVYPKGRGYLFLKGVKPVAVICEPFFGSSPAEWVTYSNNRRLLVEIYADAICDYFALA